MEVMDYCRNMEIELTAWKAKMFDVMSKIDKLPSGDKDKVLPQVGELKMIVTDLDDRIAKLKTECPTEWSPIKDDVEGNIDTLRGKYDQVMEVMSMGYFGG